MEIEIQVNTGRSHLNQSDALTILGLSRMVDDLKIAPSTISIFSEPTMMEVDMVEPGKMPNISKAPPVLKSNPSGSGKSNRTKRESIRNKFPNIGRDLARKQDRRAKRRQLGNKIKARTSATRGGRAWPQHRNSHAYQDVRLGEGRAERRQRMQFLKHHENGRMERFLCKLAESMLKQLMKQQIAVRKATMEIKPIYYMGEEMMDVN